MYPAHASARHVPGITCLSRYVTGKLHTHESNEWYYLIYDSVCDITVWHCTVTHTRHMILYASLCIEFKYRVVIVHNPTLQCKGRDNGFNSYMSKALKFFTPLKTTVVHN